MPFGKPNIEKLRARGDVKGLAAASRHRDAQIRKEAARALGELAPPEAVSALSAALGDPVVAVRVAAVEALGCLNDERAVSALIDLLGDREDEVATQAMDALLRAREWAAPALIATSRDKRRDARVRAGVIDALGGRWTESSDHRAVLSPEGGSSDVPEEVTQPGRTQAEQRAQALIDVVRDSEYEIEFRRKAAFSTGFLVGFWHTELPLQPLVELLHDDGIDLSVRATMAIALKNAGDARAPRSLLKAVLDEYLEEGDSKRPQEGDPRTLAGDPETAREALAALGGSEDLDVVMALARNPVTPADTLRALNRRWEHFPRSPRFLYGHLVENPACPSDLLREIERTTTNPETGARARSHPMMRLEADPLEDSAFAAGYRLFQSEPPDDT